MEVSRREGSTTLSDQKLPKTFILRLTQLPSPTKDVKESSTSHIAPSSCRELMKPMEWRTGIGCAQIEGKESISVRRL